MSSYKKRGRGYGGKGRETYRPWNAAVLKKPISEPTYDNYDTYDTYDTKDEMNIDDPTVNFRPWNAAVLRKIDTIENESLGITDVPNNQQPILFPEFSNQNNSWYQQDSPNWNNLQYLQYNTIEDLKQLNWEDYTKQLMQEEAMLEIQRQNQNQKSNFDRTLLDEFDLLKI